LDKDDGRDICSKAVSLNGDFDDLTPFQTFAATTVLWF
jgi:hypothetical protein